jgi:DNA replication protein DnaC
MNSFITPPYMHDMAIQRAKDDAKPITELDQWALARARMGASGEARKHEADAEHERRTQRTRAALIAKPVADLTQEEIQDSLDVRNEYVPESRRAEIHSYFDQRNIERVRKLVDEKFCKYAGRTYLSEAVRPIKPRDKFQEQAQALIMAWIGDPSKRFLTLYGPTGTGKSMYLRRIFRRELERGGLACVEYRRAIDIVQRYYDKLPKVYTARDLREVPILLIDDLATRDMREPIQDLFYGLIDYRYNNGLKTAITINHEPKVWKEKIGQRLTSRLIDRRYNLLAAMGGADERVVGLPMAA